MFHLSKLLYLLTLVSLLSCSKINVNFTVANLSAPPNIQFTGATQSISEGFGTYTAVVVLSEVQSVPITVPVTVSGSAANGSDFSLSTTTLTFNPGSLSETIVVTVGDDHVIEPDETIILNLGTPSSTTLGTHSIQTITIVDNDTPKITGLTKPADGLYLVGDSLSFSFTFSEAVTVTGSPSVALSINGSTVSANYVSGSGTSALVFS